MLCIIGRLEFVNIPGHAADLQRYCARGYRMSGNRIAIVTDDPEDLIKVHPPSPGSMDPVGLAVERCPPKPVMAHPSRAFLASDDPLEGMVVSVPMALALRKAPRRPDRATPRRSLQVYAVQNGGGGRRGRWE